MINLEIEKNFHLPRERRFERTIEFLSLTAPADGIEIICRSASEFYTPDFLRRSWVNHSYQGKLEVAGIHLYFLQPRSVSKLRNQTSEHRDVPNLPIKTAPKNLTHSDKIFTEADLKKIADEIEYRLQVQLFVRRGIRIHGSPRRNYLDISESRKFAHQIEYECHETIACLRVLRRAQSARHLDLVRKAEEHSQLIPVLSSRDAGTLGAIAQGRNPFSLLEDNKLQRLTESCRTSSGRINWVQVTAKMHSAFTDLKRSAPVYQQRFYKLARRNTEVVGSDNPDAGSSQR